MKKLTDSIKLFLVFGLISTTLSCGVLPPSECELTAADGKNILGVNVEAIDKNSSAFGGAANDDKNFRACGYVFKEPTEQGYLYWVQRKSEDEQEAKRLFEISAKKPSDATNFSTEQISKLGDEARVVRYEAETSKTLNIAVRKGKSNFLIAVSKPSASEIAAEQVKSLAERIAAQTTDY